MARRTAHDRKTDAGGRNVSKRSVSTVFLGESLAGIPPRDACLAEVTQEARFGKGRIPEKIALGAPKSMT